MPDQAQDGRPEVQIRSTLRKVSTDATFLTTDFAVTHEVACVWCPWSFHTADVRSAADGAREHEMSLSHTHSREEALAEGRKRRELWD
jgi:hypothetical protein